MSFPFIIADDMDDIVILSAPFVAGVALAAGIAGGAPAGWLPAQMAGCLAGPAAVFGAVLAGAIGFAARKDGRKHQKTDQTDCADRKRGVFCAAYRDAAGPVLSFYNGLTA